MDQITIDFMDALLKSDRVKAKVLLKGIHEDNDIERLSNIFVLALEEIGKRWETGTVALTQLYMSGRICEELLDLFKNIEGVPKKEQPNIAFTVLHDFHTLGKTVVSLMLSFAGYTFLDLGTSSSIESLVQILKEKDVKILLISVLMLNSALKVKDVVQAINDENLSVKVVVGGAPFRFDKDLWKDVGANYTADNAFSCVKVLDKLIQEMSDD